MSHLQTLTVHGIADAPREPQAASGRRWVRTFMACSALAAIGWILAGGRVSAETVQQTPRIVDVRIGFDGHFKTGHWTCLTVTVRGGRDAAKVQVNLVTCDADGDPIMYLDEGDQPFTIPAGQTVRQTRLVQLGRKNANLTVRLTRDGRTLSEWDMPAADLENRVASQDRMILTVGGSIGMNDAARYLGRGELPRTRAVCLSRVDDLPTEWLGYDGVDALALTTSNGDLVSKISDAQHAAMQRWLQLGGRIILCCGSRGEHVAGVHTPLRQLVPGDFADVIPQRSLAGLTNYAGGGSVLSAGSPRQTVEMTLLTDIQGTIEAYEPGKNAADVPMVVRRAFGLGQLVFVAFDLEQPPFTGWSERGRLAARLLRDEPSTDGGRDDSSRSGKVVHVGYRDLSGQFRSALEQFAGVTRVQFSWIAALVLSYIVVIGPADYFLLKRFASRMQWSWLTFPLATLLFCVLAVLLTTGLKGRSVRVNCVQLVDVDVRDRLIRGNAWLHVFSPSAATYDAACYVAGGDGVVSTFGLTGSGLGAMDTNTTVRLFEQPYTARCGAAVSGVYATVCAAPVPASGSKGFAARWCEPLVMQHDQPVLRAEGGGMLRGRITNPLDVDLDDCMILYKNWAFRIDGRLPPGGSLETRGLRALNLEWRLTRRTVITEKHDAHDVATPWDQSDLDVPRILEMMMFYDAARGETYTGLEHRYQAAIDLSALLRLDRAVLVGRSESKSDHVRLNGRPTSDYSGRRWQYYRIVFPVQPRE